MKLKRGSQTRLKLNDYAALLADVKERIRAAQYAALKAVNKELIVLYWDIGKLIANPLMPATFLAASAGIT